MPSAVWRSAGRQHRQALSQFICADPEKQSYDPHRGRHHPKPWEYEVQSHLRGLKVPVPDGSALALGTDAQGIVGAVHYGFVGEDEQFLIWAVATACRARGRGHGRQAVDYAIESCRLTKEQYDLDCGVFTRIDPRNEPSRRLFQSRGFEYLDVYRDLELWVRDL
ncbi:GNAT family N-acetyltransferase [Cellulomonas hominis]|uniref:GNAT family N-acetyltransferase n=1 Tax=Cellulomonas hominis TaxID=156981 RepID=UPI0014445853|nr:GNAT family N-acetyltransferase [Cellulomonas hominis]NKY08962.1 GNAT family N-acetyltransferase [Cellulomonas hominis]